MLSIPRRLPHALPDRIEDQSASGRFSLADSGLDLLGVGRDVMLRLIRKKQLQQLLHGMR